MCILIMIKKITPRFFKGSSLPCLTITKYQSKCFQNFHWGFNDSYRRYWFLYSKPSLLPVCFCQIDSNYNHQFPLLHCLQRYLILFQLYQVWRCSIFGRMLFMLRCPKWTPLFLNNFILGHFLEMFVWEFWY